MLVIVRYQTASNYGSLPPGVFELPKEVAQSPHALLRNHQTKSRRKRTGERGPLRRAEKGGFFARHMNEFAHVISHNIDSVELQSDPIGFCTGISSQGTHWPIVRALGIRKCALPVRMIGMQWPSRSRSVCRLFSPKGEGASLRPRVITPEDG